MDPDALRARTKKFAVDAIRFAKRLPNDRITNRIIGQLTDQLAPSRQATALSAGTLARRFHLQAGKHDRGGR